MHRYLLTVLVGIVLLVAMLFQSVYVLHGCGVYGFKDRNFYCSVSNVMFTSTNIESDVNIASKL